MAVIAVGADHAGFALKEELKTWLLTQGHHVCDYGTHADDPVDYPDFAGLVAEAVADGSVEHGLLVCGSGVGMAIAANKVVGIRAAVAADVETARLCREHNDTNVLALGARVTAVARAQEIVAAWLGTAFAEGRHRRRLDKLADLERARTERAGAAG